MGDALIRAVRRPWNRHPHRQAAVGIEAQINIAKRRERPDHQPGADDEDDGQRHFDGHEGAAQPLPAVADGGVLAAFAQ